MHCLTKSSQCTLKRCALRVVSTRLTQWYISYKKVQVKTFFDNNQKQAQPFYLRTESQTLKQIKYDSNVVILYQYWLHERATREIDIPTKPMSTEAKPNLTLVFSGWQFPMLPSRAVNNYYIILNYVWFRNNRGQVNTWVCIPYSVSSNNHSTTPVRIYGER